MHGANPLAGQLGVHDQAVLGQPRPHHGADEHLRFEPAVGVVHIHPHLDRSRLAIEHGVDEGHRPGECFTSVRFGLELDRLSVAQPRQVGFIRIQFDPQMRQVGNRVDPRARVDVHALGRVLVYDNAADGGVDGHVVRGLSALFNPPDLRWRESPQPQFLAASLDQRLRRQTNALARDRLDIVEGLDRPQQLDLRDKQFRAIHVDQVIALLDRDTRVVDVQPVQTSRHPGGDVLQAGFVIVDLAHHSDFRLDELAHDGRDFDLRQFLG